VIYNLIQFLKYYFHLLIHIFVYSKYSNHQLNSRHSRQLQKKAERYERTKAISKMVNTIQNSVQRLTNLQKEKYYNLLNKYPDNEVLLSI